MSELVDDGMMYDPIRCDDCLKAYCECGPYDDSDDEEDEWGCELGEDCLMPSFIHRRSECYTVEMAQVWQDE